MQTKPRRISSRATFFNKRIFPFIWFGVIAFVTAAGLSGMIAKGKVAFVFPLGAAMAAILGYFLMKKIVFDLVDEVWDSGDTLIVKNNDQVERISLSEIMNVSYSIFTNPQRVTLTLR